MSDSRISGLHRLKVAERIAELQRRGWLSAGDAEKLRQGRHVLSPARADKIIENVIGVFGLPFAIAPNFLVNNRDYIVPMVVEEPSIVAATSNAARLARATGGFTAECAESLLTGQVHVSDVAEIEKAIAALKDANAELLDLANSVHPRLSARGGGVREIELHRLQLADDRPVIAVHFLVDTCDAMGANLVNGICEFLAPTIAELCGGNVALRILSNLADRSIVVARACYALDDLATEEFDAATVRDGIILANDIALADPHRAATHNKGIMNGIDALAIATGNDWRAVEAGAHAYAAAKGSYLPLTSWSVDELGNLFGEIRIPLKVGITGGTLGANPAAAVAIDITGVGSARELAELMAALGLAQNFAALKALASGGIQRGHMRLHARSIAATAGVPDEFFDDVVGELIADGDIKIQKARELLAGTQQSMSRPEGTLASAAGKVILLGEHAAVYGKHVVALPIADAVSAAIMKTDAGLTVSVPQWGVSQELITDDGNVSGIAASVALILRELDLAPSGYAIQIHSKLPAAMGLGSSAAFAVAIVRAFDAHLSLGLDNDKINAIAYECEKLAHGTPSGVDNTIATYGEPVLFSNAESLQVQKLTLIEVPPLVIACSNRSGPTREQVAGVRSRYTQNRVRYTSVFEEIDEISLLGAAALERADYRELGSLMNICHGLLNAIEVSTPELEHIVTISREYGAVGAKLTGAGGGGSVVALCPGTGSEVTAALHSAGFRTIELGETKIE